MHIRRHSLSRIRTVQFHTLVQYHTYLHDISKHMYATDSLTYTHSHIHVPARTPQPLLSRVWFLSSKKDGLTFTYSHIYTHTITLKH